MVPHGAAAVPPGVGVFGAVRLFLRDVSVKRHAPLIRGAPRSPPSALGRTRHAVPAPEAGAGRDVVGVEVASTSLLAPANAGDDAPLDGDRRAGHVVALLVVADLGLP